jgi:hypothetical protein
MRGILIRGAAGLALVLAAGACSSDSSKSSTTIRPQDTTAPSSAPTPGSGSETTVQDADPDATPASDSAETPTSESTETTATTAPTGDGHWHPVVASGEAESDDADVPQLVRSLIDGQPVETASAAASSFYEARAFAVVFDATCDVEFPALVAGATAAELHIVASGNLADTSWLVIDDGAYDGANLSFSKGDVDGTCEMDGLPLTPVHLTLSGSVNDTITAFVGVGCGAAGGEGVNVGIWGAPLDGDPTTAAMIWVTTVDGAGPGAHVVREEDQTVFSTGDVWTLQQIFAMSTADAANGGDGAVAGLNSLSGTVTLTEGLASGSLDVSTADEHITGTFACGTPLYSPPVIAPADPAAPPTT